MSDRASFQPSPLTEEEFQRKLASEYIMEKFEALKYEIHQMELGKFSFLRLLAYLEWFFDKVLEKKVPDEVAQERLLKLNFENKMDLMKKYGLLIEKNYHDVDLIREIRNDIAHSLLFNQEEINKKLSQKLQNYSSEDFKELHPFDKCIGLVGDVMGILATAINTYFEYRPTKSKK